LSSVNVVEKLNNEIVAEQRKQEQLKE